MPATATRPPRSFSTTVDIDFVDVEISAKELEEAGWVFAGTSLPTTERLAQLIRVKHDAEHAGPMRFCTDDLCREVTA